MPCAFIPPGYHAVLVGQAVDIEDLGAFAPLEQNSAEGTPVLLKLEFSEIPNDETLAGLEQACRDAQIEPFPGSEFFVYVGQDMNCVYLVWQKGMPWLVVIIGILITMVLPPLLGAGIWLILPDSIKSLISSLVNIGMMLLMMWLVISLVKPMMAPAKEKPRLQKETAE